METVCWCILFGGALHWWHHILGNLRRNQDWNGLLQTVKDITYWSPQLKDVSLTSTLLYCSCCLLSGFTGIGEDYLFVICKPAKNVLRSFRERKLIVMTWLLRWKTLQPDLIMMLSVSRAKNRRRVEVARICGELVWCLCLCVCVCCLVFSIHETGIKN